MIDIEIEDLIPNMFQRDIDENGGKTHISQLGIITIKSLLPAKEDMGNKVDYKRFNEELKLWRYYRNDQAKDILNQEEVEKPNIYFKTRDRTLGFRLLPIIIANRDYPSIEEQLIKNILFTRGNIEDLLEGLLIGRSLYLLIENQEDILKDLKEYIINFSQVDFLRNYGACYKIPLSKYSNFSIDFERRRIEIIGLLNGLQSRNFPILEDILKIIEGKEGKSFLGQIIYQSQKNIKKDFKLCGFTSSMTNYIIRLRKSRIEPERLEIKEYCLPDIFSFDEGEVFYHSLLNQSKVIKKEASNNLLTSIVQSKTGMYRFKRDLN